MVNKPLADAIADRVRADLEASGLSVNELASATGIPRVTLARRLNGSPLNVTELASVASALGCSVSDWMRDAEHSVQGAA